jgi:hypothetical protein
MTQKTMMMKYIASMLHSKVRENKAKKDNSHDKVDNRIPDENDNEMLSWLVDRGTDCLEAMVKCQAT